MTLPTVMPRNTRARPVIRSSRRRSPVNAGSTVTRTTHLQNTERRDEGTTMDCDGRTDDHVDEAFKRRFPASDPPANTVETGVRVEAESSRVAEFAVRNHREVNRTVGSERT